MAKEDESMTGTMTVVLLYNRLPDEPYHRNRGDVQRKNVQLAAYDCTEDEAVKMAAKFREINPGVTLEIQWIGPKKL